MPERPRPRPRLDVSAVSAEPEFFLFHIPLSDDSGTLEESWLSLLPPSMGLQSGRDSNGQQVVHPMGLSSDGGPSAVTPNMHADNVDNSNNQQYHQQYHHQQHPPPTQIVDHAVFDQILDMDDCDPQRTFSKSLVHDFFAQAQDVLGKLDQGRRDRMDLLGISRLGHLLKGSSATMGIVQLRRCCEQIQYAGERRKLGPRTRRKFGSGRAEQEQQEQEEEEQEEWIPMAEEEAWRAVDEWTPLARQHLQQSLDYFCQFYGDPNAFSAT